MDSQITVWPYELKKEVPCPARAPEKLGPGLSATTRVLSHTCNNNNNNDDNNNK